MIDDSEPRGECLAVLCKSFEKVKVLRDAHALEGERRGDGSENENLLRKTHWL